MSWSSKRLFEGISVRPSCKELKDWKEFLWNDLCAEFDSKNLYQEIQKRKSQYSDDFLSFIDRWYSDERNHAYGFARIYEILFDVPILELWQKLESRPYDFSYLEDFLNDEFKLICLLAYDELATTHTYHKDVAFYRELGHPAFTAWIDHLKKDEASHYLSAIGLLKRNHLHRLDEASTVMSEILKLDLNQKQYQATFVLDHSADCTHFQLDAMELTTKCASFIARRLNRLREIADLKEEVLC